MVSAVSRRAYGRRSHRGPSAIICASMYAPVYASHAPWCKRSPNSGIGGIEGQGNGFRRRPLYRDRGSA